jgi:hypothetical protein
MSQEKTHPYPEPTQESGRQFFAQGITGPVVMLNLLRFRATSVNASVLGWIPNCQLTMNRKAN